MIIFNVILRNQTFIRDPPFEQKVSGYSLLKQSIAHVLLVSEALVQSGWYPTFISCVKTPNKPSEDVEKYLKNCINAKINEWNRSFRCAVPGKQGGLIRCPDCNKCSNCPSGVKPEDRQPTIINWEEPENITCYEEQDNPVMNEAETELELDAIIEAMKRKNSDIAEVFVRYYLHGYEVSEIASDLGMQERRVRYLLKQGEEIRDRMMNY